ncbi:hypothetical protein D1007_20505 [Hordeum vulgare]|nr:hypothetical protein D1007_20505 [Hordeum vulgare]
MQWRAWRSSPTNSRTFSKLPQRSLFRHFFLTLIEDKNHCPGNISWIPQGKKEDWGYLPGQHHEKWEDWRGDWCWNKDDKAPEFCSARTGCISRGSNWTSLGFSNNKLGSAATGSIISRLLGLPFSASGLTSFGAALHQSSLPEEPELLEELDGIGKDVSMEAERIATAEIHGSVARELQ